MTCEPFCDRCGGNLGHPANGRWLCRKCEQRPPYTPVRFDTDPKTGNPRFAA